MKKIYKTPALRYIDLEAEQMIAASAGVDNTEENAIETDGAWTNKKENLWDREGIWK